MGQDIHKIEGLYDRIAAEYAETFVDDHERKPKDREILRRFADEVAGKSPVWDFGCGPGQTTKYLKNLGVSVSGLDLSDQLLEQARAHHPDIHFQKGNILDLQFDNDSIAGVVAFYAFVHFSKDQIELAFREIFRVLIPGGTFLLTFHVGEETIHIDEFLGKEVDIDFMFFSAEIISQSLKDCGFIRIEVIEREPYAEIEYQSRRAYMFAKKPAEIIIT